MTKRRTITTTYRREYSPDRSASRASVVKNCGANYQYREERRQLEHGHHKSPFVWGDWEYEMACVDQYKRAHPSKGTPKDGGAGALKSSYSESSIESSRCPSNIELQDQEVQTSVRVERRKQSGRTSRSSSTSSVECDCDCGASRERKSKPQQENATPRALSDTISKKLKKVSKRKPGPHRPDSAPQDDSPFAQYGMGDDEVETGNKRTYNILSKQGVYPSAANAHVRHQSAKQVLKARHLEEPRPHKTTLFNPRFDQRMNRQTSKWISEYQKKYQQFPTDEYTNHVYHRPPY